MDTNLLFFCKTDYVQSVGIIGSFLLMSTCITGEAAEEATFGVHEQSRLHGPAYSRRSS